MYNFATWDISPGAENGRADPDAATAFHGPHCLGMLPNMVTCNGNYGVPQYLNERIRLPAMTFLHILHLQRVHQVFFQLVHPASACTCARNTRQWQFLMIVYDRMARFLCILCNRSLC